jgi:cell division protein FtsQ
MVYEAGLVISRDEFLKAMIEQVYVNANQKMELVPQLGRQIILLGDGSNLEGKFLKLKAFYKDEMDKNRWATYSTIDIQYENQIVCTKY